MSSYIVFSIYISNKELCHDDCVKCKRQVGFLYLKVGRFNFFKSFNQKERFSNSEINDKNIYRYFTLHHKRKEIQILRQNFQFIFKLKT